MKVAQLYEALLKFLSSDEPVSQAPWDNSGIQIETGREIKRVLLALSISKEVVDEALELGADLIISHHPLLFKGLKNFLISDPTAELVKRLLKADVAVIALHTDLDASLIGPSALILKKLSLEPSDVLAKEGGVSYGFVAQLKTPLRQREILKRLIKSLPRDVYRLVNYKPDVFVETLAVCSGSGSSLIPQAARRAQLYISGDVKYHDAELARMLDLTVFDMGHFGTERLFYEALLPVLKEIDGSLEVIVSSSESSPFEGVGDEGVYG